FWFGQVGLLGEHFVVGGVELLAFAQRAFLAAAHVFHFDRHGHVGHVHAIGQPNREHADHDYPHEDQQRHQHAGRAIVGRDLKTLPLDRIEPGWRIGAWGSGAHGSNSAPGRIARYHWPHFLAAVSLSAAVAGKRSPNPVSLRLMYRSASRAAKATRSSRSRSAWISSGTSSRLRVLPNAAMAAARAAGSSLCAI